MENPSDHEHQRLLLLRAIRHARISVGELWLHFFAIGGDAGEYEVEAYLHGSFTLPPLQRDLLAHAANELIDDRPPPRAPYSTDASEPADSPGPGSGPGGYGAAIAFADGVVDAADKAAASGPGGHRQGSFARIEDGQDGDREWAPDEGGGADGRDSV
ncbi:hypothetical protein ACX80W_04250 [Arthrobacter sp. TMN-37]